MRALNRGRVREFNPNRKDPHWGKRKLKRDSLEILLPGASARPRRAFRPLKIPDRNRNTAST
jgi:hypothetical protein